MGRAHFCIKHTKNTPLASVTPITSGAGGDEGVKWLRPCRVEVAAEAELSDDKALSPSGA